MILSRRYVFASKMDRKIRRSRGDFKLFINCFNILTELHHLVEIDDTKSELPQIQRYTLVHFKQRFDWDCGISCVMMVLSRRQRQEFLRYFGQICTEQGFGTRYWTSILKRFSWVFMLILVSSLFPALGPLTCAIFCAVLAFVTSTPQSPLVWIQIFAIIIIMGQFSGKIILGWAQNFNQPPATDWIFKRKPLIFDQSWSIWQRTDQWLYSPMNICCIVTSARSMARSV